MDASRKGLVDSYHDDASKGQQDTVFHQAVVD